MGLGVEVEGKRVFEGEMDGCCVSWEAVKSGVLAGLTGFRPRCVKHRQLKENNENPNSH